MYRPRNEGGSSAVPLSEEPFGASRFRVLATLGALALALTLSAWLARPADATLPSEGEFINEGALPLYVNVKAGDIYQIFLAPILCTESYVALELGETWGSPISIPLEVGKSFEIHMSGTEKDFNVGEEEPETSDIDITGTLVTPYEITGSLDVSASWPGLENCHSEGSFVLTNPPGETMKEEEERKAAEKKKEDEKKQEEERTRIRGESSGPGFTTIYEIEVMKPRPLTPPPPEEEAKIAGEEPCPPSATGGAQLAKKYCPPKLTAQRPRNDTAKGLGDRQKKIPKEIYSPGGKGKKAIQQHNALKAGLKHDLKLQEDLCVRLEREHKLIDKVINPTDIPAVKYPKIGKAVKALLSAPGNIQLIDCRSRLSDMKAALAIAQKDPPAASFAAVSLPMPVTADSTNPCQGFGLTPAELTPCEALIKDQEEAAVDLERTGAIGDAIGDAIDRYSGAVIADNESGATLQEDAYLALLAELAQVSENFNSAALLLADALKDDDIDVTVPGALVEHPVSVLEGLAKHASGEARKTLEVMSEAARLVPSISESYVASLSAPTPIGAIADAGTLTPNDLIVLLRQLAEQGQINSAAATAMTGQLEELKTAQGSARSPLLKKLATEFRQVGGQAGTLLEAATAIPSPDL